MNLVGFDFTALTGYYNAKINYNLASTLGSSSFSSAASEASETTSSSEVLPWRREVDTKTALIAALGAQSFLPASVAKDARAADGDVPKILAAYEALARQGVFVRYYSRAELADYLRISVGTPEQTTQLINAIGQALAE